MGRKSREKQERKKQEALLAQYTIENLTDPRNSKLCDDVKQKLSLQLQRSKDGGWGALVDQGKTVATITFSVSRFPKSCFAHELLHVDLSLKGCGLPWAKPKTDPHLTETVPFVYNQLAHHHFFDRFVSMGFPAEEFLNDNELEETNQLLSRSIKELESLYEEYGSALDGVAVALPYLAVKSPHRSVAPLSVQEQAVLASLQKVSSPKFLAKLDGVLSDCKTTPFNPSLLLAKFFGACQEAQLEFTPTGNQADLIKASDFLS